MRSRATSPRTCCVRSRARCFSDPVFVPCSGNTYEREALEKFWASAPGRARDPLTNVETRANSRVVYTNWDKRREVRDYLDAQVGGLRAERVGESRGAGAAERRRRRRARARRTRIGERRGQGERGFDGVGDRGVGGRERRGGRVVGVRRGSARDAGRRGCRTSTNTDAPSS